MIYLEDFRFPDWKVEEKYITNCIKDGISDYYLESIYPFYVLSGKDFYCMDFEPITLLYGGNGCGKSTALNVIAQKLNVQRNSAFNSSYWMKEYVNFCLCHVNNRYSGGEYFTRQDRDAQFDISSITKMLTSDDIFNMMQRKRVKNEQTIVKSKILHEDRRLARKMPFDTPRRLDFETGKGVQEYIDKLQLRRGSFNQLMRTKIGKIEQGMSNGETSLMELNGLIQEPGLYILDEPENSLASDFQRKLAQIIEYAAKYCDAQFIIATHSPFLLSLPGAKISSFDTVPVSIQNWWELENMQQMFQLFEEYRDKFIDPSKQNIMTVTKRQFD